MTSHSTFWPVSGFSKFIAGAIVLCGVSQVSFPASAQVFNNLHNLALRDGSGPFANLIVSSNTLYGTAHKYGGGSGGGSGSIFRLNTDGSGFTNLHTFSGTAPEGGNLAAALVLSGKTLYTTATFGGSSNYGCIVAIGIDGSGLTNVYNFSAPLGPFPTTNLDGADPSTGLILSGGTLYGLASGGGQHGWGTAFAVSTNGTGFTNLHSFTSTDGQNPASDLMLSGGTLFGATAAGGATHYGTLYRMGTNGADYTNFYSFPADSGPDRTNYEGVFPACSLVLLGTNLYGTASEGGDFGGGTVFMIDTNGTALTTLHAFAITNGITGTNSGGARPQSGLTLAGNVLYGTTFAGGTSGNGTVFKINTDGSGFTTLYNFSATNGMGTNGVGGGTNFDGAHPVGGLLLSGGTLYGTASEGGTAGFGTVFSISFPPTLTIALAGTNAIVTWPTNVTGFNLESATNLPSAIWNPVTGQYSVTNPISGRQKFYRLKSP
jgi:uncharacterized repeat protein (TIGR03803 family)